MGTMGGGSDRESSLIPDPQLLSLATRQSIVACGTDGNNGFLRGGDCGHERSAEVTGPYDFFQLAPRGHRTEQSSRRQTASNGRSAIDVGRLCTDENRA